MNRDGIDQLLVAPTVAEWRHQLARSAQLELGAFTQMELAAAGAVSPLRGLTVTTAFESMDGPTLERELAAAREDLFGRRLMAGSGPFRLGGVLAAVTAVRRRPALLATVAVVGEREADIPGSDRVGTSIVAVLHGVAEHGVGLFALLEETVHGESLHYFCLTTPSGQADRITESLSELALVEPEVSLSVDVFSPDPSEPRRTRIVLSSGQVRRSDDGISWQESTTPDRWPTMLGSALTVPLPRSSR